MKVIVFERGKYIGYIGKYMRISVRELRELIHLKLRWTRLANSMLKTCNKYLVMLKKVLSEFCKNLKLYPIGNMFYVSFPD